MFSGVIEASVLAVAPVSIHGDSYADVTVQTDAQRAADVCSVVRVPAHALTLETPAPGPSDRGGWRGLCPGARVRLELLMGQVVRAGIVPARGPTESGG